MQHLRWLLGWGPNRDLLALPNPEVDEQPDQSQYPPSGCESEEEENCKDSTTSYHLSVSIVSDAITSQSPSKSREPEPKEVNARSRQQDLSDYESTKEDNDSIVSSESSYYSLTDLDPQEIAGSDYDHSCPKTPEAKAHPAAPMVSPTMPPAPTPPVNNMASGSSNDRTAGLLNLLKFSGSGQAQASPPFHPDHHSSPSGSQHSHHQQPGPPSYMHHHYGSSSQQSPMEHSGNFPTTRHQPQIMAPAPSMTDPSGLLAALMRGNEHSEDHRPPMAVAPASMPTAPEPPTSFGQSSPPSNTRNFLLNLLNQPKPSQDDQPRSSTLTPQSPDTGDTSRGRQYPDQSTSGLAVRTRVPSGQFDFEPRSLEHHVPTYNYNMSEASDAAGQISSLFGSGNTGGSMRALQHGESFGSFNQSPSETPMAGSYQILKKPKPSESPLGPLEHKRQPRDRSPISSSPEHSRRKVDHAMSPDDHTAGKTPASSESAVSAAAPEKNKETVAEAVSDIAETASREAREALARAEEEHNQAEIAQDIDNMVNARTEEEFKEAAKHAAQAIKKELDRPEHSTALEDHLPSNVAKEVRESLDDTAQAVADNWENADANEILVIEEEQPIKVYNFPVQPWISITMKEDGTEPRPEFRDSAIMDIAKLKKEFDQYDRNLYTATHRYMAYAMSKHGGIHVVRQEDGKDAKVFLHTKERIFNVSMSTTPTDHAGIPRETILATGVNGNVYWVQILQGDKDHIEDTHPEQYGFLLPPLASQDGDTSGGTLKTRARVSSFHPEFFAIGRGKSINLIWPALIMKNNLFVPGSTDRVVDSEKLAQQCSLKINTGKAGKDFTFSHDDTVIVSLDKSGRVKFWDIRDMTAAKEGLDPNAPVPAETSIELKEPIMNLPSTLEGEKAWPTSVLLLDKIRPYQKRTALRYMIVGMKQNHTLQLWDLALRKPVQEFNLPHSKESDAMCSVTYHPDSGMVVIGHPTRNSVYMAHLSAPKYSFKNISQADYIMRLDARDPSMPQPDSTAVISGVREYSLANRGSLRSLDMLCTPAMSPDGDEPTLFELYVMHSKGVACLLIRRDELGWSKDNKVLNGVDAVQAKAITVAPLKALAESTDDAAAPQTKPAGRSVKEMVGQAPQVDDMPKKASNSASPVKIQTRKDENVVNNTSNPAANDKAEKKSRKKKNAGQAVDGLTNGTSPLPTKGAASAAKGGESSKSTSAQKSTSPSISQEAIDATVKSMESRLTTSLSGVVDTAVSSLSKAIDARETDFDSRQTKLLQVVSEVLNQNVQDVLGEMIEKQLSSAVIPSIAKSTLDQVSAKSAQAIQKELAKALPVVAENLVMNPKMVDTLSNRITSQVIDQIATDVSQKISDDVVNALQTNLVPSMTQLTMRTANNLVDDIQQHFQDEFERISDDRRADANKIDQLLSLVTRLSDTVSTMAASQGQFQAEFLKFQQQAVAERAQAMAMTTAVSSSNRGHSPASNSMQLSHAPQYGAQHTPQHAPQHHAPQHTPQQHQQPPPPQALSPADVQIAEQMHAINQSVHAQRMEEAVIRWLQSGHEDEIFSRYWAKLSPVYLRDLPPLVLLSVATTVSQHLDDEDLIRCRAKVAWLEMSIHCLLTNFSNFVGQTLSVDGLPPVSNIQVQDQQVREVTPNIMKLVVNRSEALFMRIQGQDAHDPILKNLSQLIAASKRILEATTSPQAAPRY